MKICKYMLEAINFEVNGIRYCCDVGQFDGIIPEIPFSGNRINRKDYIEKTIELIDELQDPETNLCRNCQFLSEEEHEVSASNFLIKTVSINHFRYLCNSKCVYCDYWKKLENPKYSVLEPIISLHAKQMLSPSCTFHWGGGESTILPEFEEVCNWIANNGYRQKIHTNAMRCSDAIKNVLDKDLCNIDISLDAGTAEVHKEVKGVDSWSRVLNTIESYKKHAKNQDALSIKFIVFDMNNEISEIDAFLELCKQFDLRNLEFSLDVREVKAKKVSQKSIEVARYLMQTCIDNDIKCMPFAIAQPYYSQIITPDLAHLFLEKFLKK